SMRGPVVGLYASCQQLELLATNLPEDAGKAPWDQRLGMRARRATLPRARKTGNLDPHTFEPQLLPLVVAGHRGEIVDPREDDRRRAADGLVTRCEDEIGDRSFERHE